MQRSKFSISISHLAVRHEMDWDSEVQRELYRLKKEVKEAWRDNDHYRSSLWHEKKKVKRLEQDNVRLWRKVKNLERQEEKVKQADVRKKREREKEEAIIKEAKLRIRAEEEERANIRKEKKDKMD